MKVTQRQQRALAEGKELELYTRFDLIVRGPIWRT